jgi:hypothetical protein
MKTNKILPGGIAGAVVFFLLGWVIYGILLKDFMAANYNQSVSRPMEDMVWWALILSNLGYGFLLSFVLSWSNTTSAITGARLGGIIGFLLALSVDLGFYAMSTYISNVTAILVDIIVYIVMSAIAGAVVAWVMGMVKK